jgi:hypothetical protein
MPAVLLLLLDSWRAIRQRDAGVDLLALMSIAGSLALGQPLTAAIIAAMTASGRWLDAIPPGVPSAKCPACWRVRRVMPTGWMNKACSGWRWMR